MSKENPVTFDDQVTHFAEELVLDAQDIKEAYKGKPESLNAYFNAEAKTEANEDDVTGIIVLGVVCVGLFLVAPLTLVATLPASAAILCAVIDEVGKKRAQIGDAVRKEVEAYRSARTGSPTPSNGQPG